MKFIQTIIDFAAAAASIATRRLDSAPTEQPTCTDTPRWQDSNGDGCGWYEAIDEPGCPFNGDLYDSGSGTANENCCYCDDTQPPTFEPTPPPTPPPTPAPTPGTTTEEPTLTPSFCPSDMSTVVEQRNAGFFCYGGAFWMTEQECADDDALDWIPYPCAYAQLVYELFRGAAGSENYGPYFEFESWTEECCCDDCKTLETTLEHNNGSRGSYFKIKAKGQDVIVTRLSIHTTSIGSVNRNGQAQIVKIFEKDGDFENHENNPGSWNLVMDKTQFDGYGKKRYSALPKFEEPIVVPAGMFKSFYVLSSGKLRQKKTDKSVGALYKSNDDLKFYVGRASKNLFGDTGAPRIWNGAIEYELEKNGDGICTCEEYTWEDMGRYDYCEPTGTCKDADNKEIFATAVECCSIYYEDTFNNCVEESNAYYNCE